VGKTRKKTTHEADFDDRFNWFASFRLQAYGSIGEVFAAAGFVCEFDYSPLYQLN
jgi:hypothetical protein